MFKIIVIIKSFLYCFSYLAVAHTKFYDASPCETSFLGCGTSICSLTHKIERDRLPSTIDNRRSSTVGGIQPIAIAKDVEMKFSKFQIIVVEIFHGLNFHGHKFSNLSDAYSSDMYTINETHQINNS